jgi:RNA polymerase sigma factor (sigma-70 family)
MSNAGGKSQGIPKGPIRLAGRAMLAAQSDERLVELARRGSEPAFEAIVERYRRPLGRYCGALVPPSRVEDILQHTFLTAYRTLRSDGRELMLKPWLFRVSHNAALDVLRREARGYDQLDESLDGVERPDQALERKESVRALVAGLGGLPARQRAALVLRELEGRSYPEIEQELGLAGGALRQLLYRARSNLRTAVSALTPPALFLRPELPLGLAGGAGAAKAGTVLATTAVIGAAALSTGGEKPRANPADKPEGASGALTGARSPEGKGGRHSEVTGPERGRARPDAGGRRASRRSADGPPDPTRGRPERRSASASPVASGEDDSTEVDDGPEGDDGGGDDGGGDDGSSGGEGIGGDDDSAPRSPVAGGDQGGDDVGETTAPAVPAPPEPPDDPPDEKSSHDD